jgi:Uma2 family endonuclease
MNTVWEKTRFTTRDLELLPENEWIKYEIIDGELYMTRAPHASHQRTCGRIFRELQNWSEKTGLGESLTTVGVLFSEYDNVIPDVIWISNEKLELLLDESGHLTGAPELIVEVLSAGKSNEDRDKEAKFQLYANYEVREYWIVDWRLQQMQVYRRENGTLKLIGTLLSEDTLTTPILPDFSCVVSKFF